MKENRPLPSMINPWLFPLYGAGKLLIKLPELEIINMIAVTIVG
jgi:hypothetical protein